MLTTADIHRVRWWCWHKGTGLRGFMRAAREKRTSDRAPPTIDQWRNLLLPGVRQYVGHLSYNPFQRCREIDLRVDRFGNRLVLEALWKDGSRHEAYLTLAELEARDTGFNVWKERLREIAPEHTFEDEIVVAYDDSGWL